jgi:hypothetical protein
MNKERLTVVVVCFYMVVAGAYGFWAHHKTHQWTQQRAERIASSPKVYITAEGKKYHNERHYPGKSKEVSLYEAKELGLEACKICFRQRIRGGSIVPNSMEQEEDGIVVLPLLPWPVLHWITVLIISSVICLTTVLLSRGGSPR